MKIGLLPQLRILSKYLDSKRGLRWQLAACILVYGLLDWNPELLPGFGILLNRGHYNSGGIPATALDSVCAQRLTQLIAKFHSSDAQRPRQLICLAATINERQSSQGPLESEPASPLERRTLDTTTCWEVHND